MRDGCDRGGGDIIESAKSWNEKCFINIYFQTRDPDFLNDGALQATPLNIVLSGPSGPYQQPRYKVLVDLVVLTNNPGK